MPYRPRKDRLINLAGKAADDARARGISALDAALLAIETGFGDAREHNELKRRVEINLRRGANDHEVRLRYGVEADRLGPPDCLATTILIVRRAMVRERDGIRHDVRVGRSTSRARLDRLQEIHLILRWLRFKGLAEIWSQILESIEYPPEARRPSLFVISGGRGYELAEAAE